MASDDFASRLPHSTTFQVLYRDTDAQGHLYFANYMVYGDEAAGFYMEELGFSYAELSTSPTLTFTVNINCDFLDECRIYDTVRVFVGYQRLGNASAELAFELYNDETGAALARGVITQVFVDRETRKSSAIPADFRAAILARQPELA